MQHILSTLVQCTRN